MSLFDYRTPDGALRFDSAERSSLKTFWGLWKKKEVPYVELIQDCNQMGHCYFRLFYVHDWRYYQVVPVDLKEVQFPIEEFRKLTDKPGYYNQDWTDGSKLKFKVDKINDYAFRLSPVTK
jgi:hypothetical protein